MPCIRRKEYEQLRIAVTAHPKLHVVTYDYIQKAAAIGAWLHMGEHASFTTARQRQQPDMKAILGKFKQAMREPGAPTDGPGDKLSLRDKLRFEYLFGSALSSEDVITWPLQLPQALAFDDQLESDLRSKVPEMPMILVVGKEMSVFIAKLITKPDFDHVIAMTNSDATDTSPSNSRQPLPIGCTYRSLQNFVSVSYLDTLALDLTDGSQETFLQLHRIQAAIANTWIKIAKNAESVSPDLFDDVSGTGGKLHAGKLNPRKLNPVDFPATTPPPPPTSAPGEHSPSHPSSAPDSMQLTTFNSNLSLRFAFLTFFVFYFTNPPFVDS
jgi:hypothetical protein